MAGSNPGIRRPATVGRSTSAFTIPRGYDPAMSKPRPAEQLRPTSDEAERQRIVAKIERGLASLDAGRGVPHAEVLAMIEKRYPGSK